MTGPSPLSGPGTASGEKKSSRQALGVKAIERLLQLMERGRAGDFRALGNRCRGPPGRPRRTAHFEPALVTAEVKSAIESVSAFAPLHNRAELEGMESSRNCWAVPQVAVFDTGFHRTMPRSAKPIPGPTSGSSREFAATDSTGSIINIARNARRVCWEGTEIAEAGDCHLGNGCSLAAIREGESMDTTMGFTPLEGLMMGTRSGSVDPGILTYLMRIPEPAVGTSSA
jgi:acetate kinase